MVFSILCLWNIPFLCLIYGNSKSIRFCRTLLGKQKLVAKQRNVRHYKIKQDAREAMRVVFFCTTKCICMHKTKYLMNIFKYCLKNYIKLHEFANRNSANYDV